jgi:hypothetical protein
MRGKRWMKCKTEAVRQSERERCGFPLERRRPDKSGVEGTICVAERRRNDGDNDQGSGLSV